MWTEEKLNEILTTPSEKLVDDIKKIKGDIMVLGAGGKMGPTLCTLAKRMKAELFMTTGLMDTICPPSTQFAMYNKVTSKKKVDLYPEYGHETQKGVLDRIFEFFSDL